ncbi:MAG: NAD(P)/FAD-dependent oxidoreductase [Flavobacteriaceae bacterium]|nr:NAD(P)/FAD-dependent oxidoreductase [Flavobacteriaceae bacterium]
MKIYDVAIVGSGPSGAMTAFYLAQKGVRVCIIEKEILPRYKTCGGGFVYRGRKDLPIDISDVIEREFYNVETFFGKDLHFTVSRKAPIITMIMRDTFDHLIVKKAKELGVDLLEGHKLIKVNSHDDYIISETTQGQIQSKFLIAADGVLSPTAKLAGWKTETRNLIPALEYEVTVSKEDFERLSKTVRFDIDGAPEGYAWCFPKKNHLSIGVLTTKKKRINLKEYYREYLHLLGITNVLKEEQHGFQIPLSSRTDGFVKGRTFLIGDAAGFAEPITAEGISNAIYSGKLVAEAIVESNLNLELAATLYEEKLHEKLVPELRSGEFLATYFYKKNPIRSFMFKKYGQRFGEYMVDILMGDKTFPVNVKKKLAQKIKESVF